MTNRIISVAACSALLLSACGGGGGGGTAPPVTPPPQTPPPATVDPDAPLAITAAKAQQTGNLVVTLGELLLQLSDVVVDTSRAVRDAGASTGSDTCPNGGISSYVFSDAGADGELNAGDTITVTYSNCAMATLDTIADGTWALDFAAPPTAAADEASFALSVATGGVTFSDTDGAEAGTLDGTLDIEHRRTATTFATKTTQSSTDLTVSLSSGGTSIVEETLRNVTVSKTHSDSTARYTVSLAGELASEILEGAVRFATEPPLSGYFNVYPDAGAITVTGAASSSVTFSIPELVSDIANASITNDADGNGSADGVPVLSPWSEAAEGFLWWDARYAPDFSAISADIDNVELYSRTPHGNTEALPTTQQFALLYSRPLDATTVPTDVVFRPLDPPGGADVMAELELDGARLLISPATALGQNTHYSMQTLTAPGLRDINGNAAPFSAFEFDTIQSLFVNAATSAVYGASLELVTLTAGATSDTGAIAGYDWTQVSGPAATIDTPAAKSTTIKLPAVSSAADIVVRLTATDEHGESASTDLTIRVFPDTTGLDTMYLDSEAGDPLVAGETLLFTSDAGTLTGSRATDNVLSVSYEPPDLSAIYSLRIAAADGGVVTTGAYDNAIAFGAAGSGARIEFTALAGCTDLTGRFDVLDVAYDTDDALRSLAVDFEVLCDGADGALAGSVRIGSTIPVPGSSN